MIHDRGGRRRSGEDVQAKSGQPQQVLDRPRSSFQLSACPNPKLVAREIQPLSLHVIQVHDPSAPASEGAGRQYHPCTYMGWRGCVFCRRCFSALPGCRARSTPVSPMQGPPHAFYTTSPFIPRAEPAARRAGAGVSCVIHIPALNLAQGTNVMG